MKQKIFIAAAIWGKNYIDTFVRFNLATQMAQGNIPSLAAFCDVTYQIVTTLEDKARLEKTSLFKNLDQLCTIDWQIMDTLFPQGAKNDNKYFFLSALQNFAMQSAIGHDFLIFNYADFIWADGSMCQLIRRFDDDTDAILSFCLPVDQRTGSAALSKRADQSENSHGVITLAPREAVAIALDHLHREAQLRFWENKKFTSTPTYIIWSVENEGVVITAYHQTILAIRVNPESLFYYNGITTNSLDGFYSGVLAANARIVHADDSDKIFVFSLYETLANSNIGGTSKTREALKNDTMRRMLKGSVSQGQRQLALAPIRARRSYNNKKRWQETESRAIATLESLHQETSFDSASYNKMYGNPLLTSHSAIHGFLRAILMQPIVLGMLRLGRQLLIATCVPANVIYNGNFNRWCRTRLQCAATTWSALPARGWIGYFKGGAQGVYAQSTEVPNANARYSLMVVGGKETDTGYIAQKLSSFSLVHIRRTGAFTCSGYVRVEGNTQCVITLNLLVPHERNRFKRCKNYGSVGHITVTKSNTWQYFELTSDNIIPLARGVLACFEVSGLTSKSDCVYLSQIKIEAGHKATAFQRSPAWREIVLRPLHYCFDMLRYQRTPTINTSNSPTYYAQQWIDLLCFGQVDYLVEHMPTRILPVTLGDHTVLDADTAIYYEIGTMPEHLINAIIYPEHLMQMLEGAEKALRHLVAVCPLFIDGQLALARNLWFQSRPKESLQQFQEAERHRLKLIDALHLKADAAVLLPSNCAHVIGLMGHLDAFIKRKLLTNDPRPYHLVVPESEIVNPVFFAYWKTYIELQFPSIVGADASSITMAYTADWNWAIPQDAFSTNHVHTGIARIQRQWDAEARPPLLTLKEEHRDLLNQWKLSQGMKADDWFVCLHVRSSGFYNDTAAQDFRNTPIQDYYQAIQAVVDAGGWVIRMGDPSAPKIQGIDMHHVVDYAHSDERSAALDVALSASCKLFVSSLSGLHTVAHAFGRPACYVNIPIFAGFPWHPGEIFIPKLYYLIAEHRILSMAEILSSNLAHADHQHQLAAAGVSLLRNTPDDITQTVMEALYGDHYTMENRLAGEAARADFDVENKRGQRDISGRLGLYFGSKYNDVLFPKHSTLSHKEADDATTPRYRYSQL